MILAENFNPQSKAFFNTLIFFIRVISVRKRTNWNSMLD